jgi:hypothetical protein
LEVALNESDEETPRDPTYYFLPASDTGSRLVCDFARAVHGRPATARLLARLELGAPDRFEDDPIRVKLAGIAFQHMGKHREADALFRRLLSIARHDEDRAAALGNLAAGHFRRDEHGASYSVALSAITACPTVLAPWLIAGAAAGRHGDRTTLEKFCEMFDRAFPRLDAFPVVTRALLEDPDLSEFSSSGPFLARIERRLVVAYERLCNESRPRTNPDLAGEEFPQTPPKGTVAPWYPIPSARS